MQPLKADPPDTGMMAEQLAQRLQVGEMLVLPHHQAAAVVKAASGLGKSVRAWAATNTHSSVLHVVGGRLPPIIPCKPRRLSPRAVRALALAALALVLAALVGCGGGADDCDDTQDGRQHNPPAQCTTHPEQCT
jgi:hypothetical protein